MVRIGKNYDSREEMDRKRETGMMEAKYHICPLLRNIIQILYREG